MNKKSLNEIAQGNEAIKTSRSEPIQQEPQRQSMDFIRSLVLDIPIQTERTQPVREEMNIEKMLEAQLESEVKKLEAPTDETDHVSLDIPLLIRILEHVREGVDNDVEIHDIVERMVSIRQKGVLTMDDYEHIAGNITKGMVPDKPEKEPSLNGETLNLESLKLLAGVK